MGEDAPERPENPHAFVEDEDDWAARAWDYIKHLEAQLDAEREAHAWWEHQCREVREQLDQERRRGI